MRMKSTACAHPGGEINLKGKLRDGELVSPKPAEHSQKYESLSLSQNKY